MLQVVLDFLHDPFHSICPAAMLGKDPQHIIACNRGKDLCQHFGLHTGFSRMGRQNFHPAVSVFGVGVHHTPCQLYKLSDMADEQRSLKAQILTHINGVPDKIGGLDRKLRIDTDAVTDKIRPIVSGCQQYIGKAVCFSYVLLTPGNYGSDFIKNSIGIDPQLAVQSSNFIGDTIDMCRELGFHGALLIGHIGKLVKLAGGMMNTHSRYGDCRMEILAAHAAAAGTDPEIIREILRCVACDDVLRILGDSGGWGPTMTGILGKIQEHLEHRSEEMEIGAMTFSKEYGLLGETPNARELLKKILEDT